MIKKLLILLVLTSFYTHSILPIGVSSIFGRISYSDLIGLIVLAFSVSKLLSYINYSSKISNVYIYAFFMVSMFFFPFVFSLSPIQTIVESLIHYYLVLLSIVFFVTFKNNLFRILIPVIINTLIIASILGFYDLIASFTGLPRIFPSRANAELMAGFRNAGQAGAYFMTFLAILYPLRDSKLKDKLSKKYRYRLNIAIVLSIIFLFASGKIAAYIGFSVGAVLYAFQSKSIKSILSVIIVSVLLFFAFNNLENIAPELYNRLNGKIQTRIVQNIEGTSNSDFFESNFGGAIRAFIDRPITGTGLGGYQGHYHQNEVHSTYIKMIGETGVLGVIGYLIFIISFLLLLKKPKRTYKNNPYYDYLFKMSPFILGSLVSWGYTYHLRKREFWILVAILLIIKYQAKLFDFNKLKAIKENNELSKNI